MKQPLVPANRTIWHSLTLSMSNKLLSAYCIKYCLSNIKQVWKGKRRRIRIYWNQLQVPKIFHVNWQRHWSWIITKKCNTVVWELFPTKQVQELTWAGFPHLRRTCRCALWRPPPSCLWSLSDSSSSGSRPPAHIPDTWWVAGCHCP